MTLAETQFPGYNVSTYTLSQLGGTLPPVEPSTIIFNTSVMLMGILILASVNLILKSGGCRLFSTCITLSAMGALGVGIFQGYTVDIHELFSMITFIFGSLAVLFSYRLGLNIPMVIISIIMGLTAMLTIISTIIF